jgi:hypothetical protein
MRAVPKVTAMRQTKERRKTYFSARAVEMAGSGKYRDWEQIEFALCFDEGYSKRADGWTVAPGENGLTSPAEKRRTYIYFEE